MTRVSLALAALLFAAPAVVAHADVAGNWRVEFVVPKGEMAVTMTINQHDDTLTGQVVNEDGEFPLKGKVAGDAVTVTWTVPDSGQSLEITMEGTIAGEFINGVARLGSVGEGSLSARRVSRNP